ncbi:MAG: PrsW family intramembrane metalloprotease [Treponema sp.]|nr:PrsW family intramembrane metalloprotease [Treponema sp.]
MHGLWVPFFLVFISSIPVIAVFIWFRIIRYPFSLVRFLFTLLAGAAAVFPALVMQKIFSLLFPVEGRWTLFTHVFIYVALIEELSRLIMLFILFWISARFAAPVAGTANPERLESNRIVIHGAAAGLVAGLGFAVLEGAIYGASSTGVLLLRAFTAAPLHGACGSRVGTAAVMFRRQPVRALFGLLAAAAIHGVYNFMIIMPGFPSIAAVLIAVSALASSVMSIWNTQRSGPPAA